MSETTFKHISFYTEIVTSSKEQSRSNDYPTVIKVCFFFLFLGSFELLFQNQITDSYMLAIKKKKQVLVKERVSSDVSHKQCSYKMNPLFENGSNWCHLK